MMSIDIKTNQEFKDGFRFFTHEDITVSLDPPVIFVGPVDEQRSLNETQFYDFQ